MAKKQLLFVHEKTGEIVTATKAGAKKMPKEYKPIEFTNNDQGKPVMRLHLEGATIDIRETETQGVPDNGDTTTN